MRTKSSTPSYSQFPLHSLDAVLSKWGIGWETISYIVGFYVIALVAALMHLTMCLGLEGHTADDEGVFSQAYITTLSALMANIFKTSLCISLGVAYTQYLWYLLRRQAFTLSMLDDLFCLQQKPFLLLGWAGWVSAPGLFLTVTLMLALSIAKIFPPGALTVTSQEVTGVDTFDVRTFQADHIGNGTVADADAHTIGTWEVFDSGWEYTGLHPVVLRTTRSTLSSGDVVSSQSPCEVNCTYTISFEGPCFVCNTSEAIVIKDVISGDNLAYPYYTSDTSYDYSLSGRNVPLFGQNGQPVFPTFYMSVYDLLGWDPEARMLMQSYTMDCQPALTTYNFQVAYENGNRNLSYTTQDIRLLSDVYSATHNTSIGENFTTPYPWTPSDLANLKVTNTFAILDSVIKVLQGNLLQAAGTCGEDETSIVSFNNGTNTTVTDFCRTSWGGGLQLATNNTIVSDTHLNINRDDLSIYALPTVNLSTDILNGLVANATFSTMFTLPYWNTTAQATTSTSHNVYTFSHPTNLLAPYITSLICALPVLVLGILALRRNGVPADNVGSFLQVLMTTQGSRELADAAAGGCLGGEGNVPAQLKEMRVRFGEVAGKKSAALVDDEVFEVWRAGFGLEGQVRPLRRSRFYGSG